MVTVNTQRGPDLPQPAPCWSAGEHPYRGRTGNDEPAGRRAPGALHDRLTKETQLGVLNEIELPLVPILAEMESLGIKTDREQRKLLIQQWSWVGNGSARAHKRKIEAALDAFERFQLAGASATKK